MYAVSVPGYPEVMIPYRSPLSQPTTQAPLSPSAFEVRIRVVRQFLVFKELTELSMDAFHHPQLLECILSRYSLERWGC
jgi:hypothetical protein